MNVLMTRLRLWCATWRTPPPTARMPPRGAPHHLVRDVGPLLDPQHHTSARALGHAPPRPSAQIIRLPMRTAASRRAAS